MPSKHQYVAILAGGVGTRFWPQSRAKLPKQFLDILGSGKTLLQATYRRFAQVVPEDHIYIVTTSEYAELVAQQLPDITPAQVVLEPARRNTAPCVAYMAFKLMAKDPDAVFVVAPSDHYIDDETAFQSVIKQGLEFADSRDCLVTLGIKPTRPHTGYGYIKFDNEVVYHNVAYSVELFTEKPQYDMAQLFLESGDFLWNSGIFIWHVRSITQMFKKYSLEIHSLFYTPKNAPSPYNTPQETEFIAQVYSSVRNISIDYAIMEHADSVYVIPAHFGWSDLGTWLSLWERCERDYMENAILASDALLYGAANNLISAPKDKLVVIQGLEDMCVIDTPDALLICRIDSESNMREINNDVKRLKEKFL